MINPAPTSKIDPAIARGNLISADAAQVVLSFPNTNYQLHLVPATPINLERGKRILGTIALQAKRIDTVGTGGEFIEPVYGRPRRVQGTVIRVQNSSIVIDAGVPIHATLTDPRQAVDQFQPGQLVSFDALPGATFTPTA
jgi:hypothetical protein